MLQLKCTGQEMKVAVDERIADKYINANKVHFEFCERWAGMTITAQFTQKQKDAETQEEEFKTYNVVVDPATYTVVMPNEIMAGEVFISAFGVHPSTGVRITSVPIKKTVDKSGFVGDGDTPIPPTPDLYAQLTKNLTPTGANRQYVSDSDGKAQWAALNIKAGGAHGSLVGVGSAASDVGTYSAAIGSGTKAPGVVAFACGSTTEASGEYAFASGGATKASGKAAFVSGYISEATGDYSSAEGYGLRAYSPNQHVQGKWNKTDSEGKYAHIVGNGESGTNRSNAHTIDWDGNAWFKGKVFVGGTSMDDATELGTGGGSGTGLPTPAGANMQLVTDKDGKWSQAERLAYPITGMVEVWPETVPTYDEGEGGFFFVDPLPADIVIGNNYIVNYNGAEYACTVTSASFGTDEDGNAMVVPVLGNRSLTGEGDPDTGEPFLIVDTGKYQSLMGVYGMMMTNDGATEATVSITAEGTTYKKVSFDYLPEGVGGIESGYVLPETTLTAREDFDGQMIVTDPLPSTLVNGQTYTVMWNGAKYDCSVVSADGSLGLGNVGLMTGGADTGEPFIFAVAPDGFTDDSGTPIYAIVMPLDGSTTVTLSISGESIKKIAPEYLDLEWVPGSSYVGEPIVAPMIKREGVSIYVFTDEEAAQMTEGTKIIVYVNDQRYESTMTLVNGLWLMAGNLSGLSEGQPNTGEPYLIWIDSDQQNINFIESGTDAVKFAIYKAGKVEKIPNKVPKELLPDVGTFYVNVEYVDGKYVADKTFDEIQLAAANGMAVICCIKINGFLRFIPYTLDNGDELYFSTLLYAWGAVYAISVCVQKDGTATYAEKQLS